MEFTKAEFTYTGNPDFNYNGQEGCEGQMETFSPHVDRVLEQNKKNPKTVWTVVEDDEGELIIIAGFHYVNRMLYFISEEEWKTEDEWYEW